MSQTIQTWTQSRLIKFLQDFVRDNHPDSMSAVSISELDVVDRLVILDEVQFTSEQGSATGASPAKYFRVLDGSGQVYVIPAFLP